MTAATQIKISHADYSNAPSFARVVAKAFSGVSVLPNHAVKAACFAHYGKRQREATIELVGDNDLQTAYRIGGEFGTLVVIDAEDGIFESYDLGDGDPDAEAAVAEALARLTA